MLKTEPFDLQGLEGYGGLGDLRSPMERNLVCPQLPEMIYGGDYNPEQWPEATWAEDARLMQEAGVNLVSLGIFAWAKLNPAPGQFDFAWMERVMDLLERAGVKVNLSNATASPPAWLGRLFPETRPVDPQGVVYQHGGRQNFTPNSAAFVDHALALGEAMAQHFKGHPALVMWHVNNEYYGNAPMSYGEVDAVAFRRWLQQRYGSLAAVNAAWGTAFWSQWYYDWEEIIPPRKAPAGPNPSMALDYARFFSDAYVELFRREAGVLQAVTPDLPVTTNVPNVLECLDLFKLSEHADFGALNCYPDPVVDEIPAFSADVGRALKPEKPWVLMEQVTSQIQWRPVNPLKRPGINRLWSMSHVARGADGIMYFQWRQGRFGGEKFHGAMVPAVGASHESRVWRETCELGADLRKLAPVLGAKTEAKAAILYSFEILWAVGSQGKPTSFDYREEVHTMHRALWEMGVTTDIVHPDKLTPGSHPFLLVPIAFMLDAAQAERIRADVAAGGCVLMTYFSSLVNENEHLSTDRFPQHLQDVFGLWVEEWDAQPAGVRNPVQFSDGASGFEGEHVFELLHATEAEVVATYEQAFYAGRPALTRHRYGEGEAWYLATRPVDRAGWRTVFERVVPVASFDGEIKAATGVECTFRVQPDGTRFLFVLNYTDDDQRVDLGSLSGRDLLTDEVVKGACSLGVAGVRVIQINP